MDDFAGERWKQSELGVITLKDKFSPVERLLRDSIVTVVYGYSVLRLAKLLNLSVLQSKCGMKLFLGIKCGGFPVLPTNNIIIITWHADARVRSRHPPPTNTSLPSSPFFCTVYATWPSHSRIYLSIRLLLLSLSNLSVVTKFQEHSQQVTANITIPLHINRLLE